MENVAIVLAAGKGKRMKMDVPKQYIELNGRPLICYSLDIFEKSFIDGIVVVVGKGEVEYFKENILSQNNYSKIIAVVEGGDERYDSVYGGLKAVYDAQYVYIHDGARPCVDEDILLRGKICAQKYGAAIAAVKVKDTIKIVHPDGEVSATPDRNMLWQVQTPQVFKYHLIKDAYDKMICAGNSVNITDDAMVMEEFGSVKVHIFEGNYNNIKVTTSEDIGVVKNILKKYEKKC